jgi:threonine/homoserine/homoserine lactone efflux protein
LTIAATADHITIPLVDVAGTHGHAIMSFTGQHELAAYYAERRFARHGGDPAEAHQGVVIAVTLPKSVILFSTAHSAFTNPTEPQWNEYAVMTGGDQALRLKRADVEVRGR